MRQDRDYLEKREQELRSEGLDASAVLTWGDPAERIVEVAESNGCDLIAMGTHGHRLIGDILYGSVATDVRHRSKIPVLLVRA
jgi:nucleotide-binding universal stress UspA family protein